MEECALLKTCNRVEVYVATDDHARAREGIETLLVSAVNGASKQDIRFLSSTESIRHLARVASGLDSMIVGEDQILTQVKDAYELGLDAGTVGKTLGEVFRKAISIGKKVRSETGVNKGKVSIGSAAVELANGTLSTLEDKTVLVIGAGEASRLVATALARHKVGTVLVASRTFEAAERLASELGGKAVQLDRLHESLRVSDAVICGTSAPHVVIGREDIVDAFGEGGPSKPLLMIDIGNPRNIARDVAGIPNVELHDIDGLRKVAEANTEQRRKEAARAERTIERELRLVLSRFEERSGSEDTVRMLHTRAARIRDAELDRAMKRLDGITDRDKKVIEELVSAVASKMLAAPTTRLRKASREGETDLIEAAQRLFELKEDD